MSPKAQRYDANRRVRSTRRSIEKPGQKPRFLLLISEFNVDAAAVIAAVINVQIGCQPLGGVDPAAREYILKTIIGSYNPDAAVIITTHLIADVEAVLDDFAFMNYGGEILLKGDADETRESTGKSLDTLFREVFAC